MGKAARFFKSLLGFKTSDSSQPSHSQPKNKQRRWSFVSQQNPRPHRRRKAAKSLDGNSLQHNHANEDEHPSKRAIAHAAEVVRIMTIRTTGCGFHSELAAAIKIQSYFRAYLARRALRALKALVKLQALVRGHILRKHTADMMRRLQALIRAQARARALRSQVTDSTTNLSSHVHAHHRGPPTPQKSEHFPHTKQDHNSISKRNNSKSYARGQERMFLDGLTNHERYKTVEVDTERRFLQSDQISFAYSQSMTTSRGSTFQPTNSSPCASCEVNSFDDSVRGGGVSTPIKSDGSKSCYGGYFDHPNYMANTESSRAKARSLSAPKMRPQLEVSNATKRDPGYKYVSAGMQQVSTMRESFTKKAYPGSGRLDRLGMPVYGNAESEFCVSYWN